VTARQGPAGCAGRGVEVVCPTGCELSLFGAGPVFDAMAARHRS
jgi:hypothetical protein